MEKNIIYAQLILAYNYCEDIFHFETYKASLIKSLRDCENIDIIHFTNNINPQYTERVYPSEKSIPIMIGKNAKFDRLYIKGILNGEKYEIILESRKSIIKAIKDNIMDFTDSLVFEIL